MPEKGKRVTMMFSATFAQDVQQLAAGIEKPNPDLVLKDLREAHFRTLFNDVQTFISKFRFRVSWAVPVHQDWCCRRRQQGCPTDNRGGNYDYMGFVCVDLIVGNTLERYIKSTSSFPWGRSPNSASATSWSNFWRSLDLIARWSSWKRRRTATSLPPTSTAVIWKCFRIIHNVCFRQVQFKPKSLSHVLT